MSPTKIDMPVVDIWSFLVFFSYLNQLLFIDTLVKEYIGNQLLSPIIEPEVASAEQEMDIGKRSGTPNKTVLTDRYVTQTSNTEEVDHSLVSVAQRAKSLMNKKNLRMGNRSASITPADMQPEGVDESVLSIKDRIRLFKENQNQSVAG